MFLSGSLNIGMLARTQHGRENVFILGFSSYKGQVLAGRNWGSPMQRMQTPPARPGSLDYKLAQTGFDACYVLFKDSYPEDHVLYRIIGHRAIGVTFLPEQEERNYVPSIAAQRYDALFFIRQTEGLQPLHP